MHHIILILLVFIMVSYSSFLSFLQYYQLLTILYNVYNVILSIIHLTYIYTYIYIYIPIVCLYDGWREYSTFVPLTDRTYIPWSNMTTEEKNRYIGMYYTILSYTLYMSVYTYRK